MGNASTAFLNPIAGELEGARPRSATALRRLGQRRRAFAIQAASYVLGTAVLLLYAYADTITLVIPAAFFLCGVTLIGIFTVLSETHICDRFADHFLSPYQVVAHVMVQLGFLVVAPQIGYAFLNVLFLIFAVASLSMTFAQALIAWTLTTIGVTPIFILSRIPIGMPIETKTERVAAALCFVLTIGQCAFVGLYGEALRNKLYHSGVKLKEAYQRIEELAEIDELTGAYNRRSIMRMLNEEISRTRRANTPCSIALIDLDWFKRINDSYGHPVGDEVLRTFAITAFANIRAIDKFGRYGGEEFLLVLPETTGGGATLILERVRRIVADLDWSAFASGMQVTISAGVATLRPDETADTFLTRADSALYAAKAKGRNRIASA